MSDVLTRWNRLPAEEAEQEILACCASRAWANQLAARRPLDATSLTRASDEIWSRLKPEDWHEAFSRHPRIGARKAPSAATAQSASWSAQEQKRVANAPDSIQDELAEANHRYEQRFGRVFIVCATGKSAQEMLDILRRRLQNNDATELLAAAEEQLKITNLRLQKWLSQ